MVFQCTLQVFAGSPAQWYCSKHWVNQWHSRLIPVYTGQAIVHWLRVRVTRRVWKYSRRIGPKSVLCWPGFCTAVHMMIHILYVKQKICALSFACDWFVIVISSFASISESMCFFYPHTSGFLHPHSGKIVSAQFYQRMWLNLFIPSVNQARP